MLTPCLGREPVLARLRETLSRGRWVTVAGPPGCGKTLVARHVATEHEGMVWAVAGGRARAPEVYDACLQAAGIAPAPGETPAQALRHALDGRGALLVIDDLGTSDGLGAELQHLLETTTDLRLMVTAPALLGGPGEQVVRVPPLPVPQAGETLAGPSVDLFLDRVRASGGHLVDTSVHEGKLRSLLDATGGLPLLIEQVAAQVALVGLANVVPPRSVADAVDTAYHGLTEVEQRTFRRFSLLRDPASMNLLAAVAGTDRAQAILVATALVRRSILEVLPDGRLDLLSPVRARAQELCTDDDRAAVHESLLAWADSVAPRHDNLGAGDAPWLQDLPAMRAAIRLACSTVRTRDLGYELANRVFSSLYTAMRAREAVEILEEVLNSGDGPGSIGAQVARRAGIAASEVRGTYEGLWQLERADEHASRAEDPVLESARTASIRAEMHLDAGDLARAEAEARRAMGMHPTIRRQAARTLVDVLVTRGDLEEASHAAVAIIPTDEHNEERWISLSARTLLARVALEQGRTAEAAAAARTAVAEARELAEDRVGLLAQTLLRQVDPSAPVSTADRDTLPWAIRLPVLTQDARDLLDAGHPAHAAGLAADVVVLADSSCLGRDAVEARLLLGHALLAQRDHAQAASTFVEALRQAAETPMPLRAADALDALALLTQDSDPRTARTLAATAQELRRPRRAVRWGLAARNQVTAARAIPSGWVVGGHLTSQAVQEVPDLLTAAEAPESHVLSALTPAEREVAERVADGLTSRQIAEALFVSPRTVDTHLAHIYRKLDISGRARLAALVADLR